MSALSLRLPNSLHARARALAEREGISLNQFVSTAVAEKLSALLTEEYLTSRAQQGNRAAFLKVLAKAHDVDPAPGDELPPPRRRAAGTRSVKPKRKTRA